MKINKLFHWLYCAVMFLPLFVLPIFALAVRSDNNYQPIDVQVDDIRIVEFNQKVNKDNFNAYSGNDYSITYDDYHVNINFNSTSISQWPNLFRQSNIENNHLIYVRTIGLASSGNIGFRYKKYNDPTIYYATWFNSLIRSDDWEWYDMYTTMQTFTNPYQYIFYLNIFDFTEMFGAGNEPTIAQFNEWYSDNSYVFTDGEKQLLNLGSITYNDTDFGSQTIYTLYKEVDTYFNYDNVFNFGDLYTWLNTNFFNGSAPLGFFIFWHLLIYWLLTSILWLLFDVLMYVPQLVHRWLDKASLS